MAKKKSKPVDLKTSATLVLHDAADYSSDGKRRIVAWLRRQINFIQRNNKNLAPRYRARYLTQ